MISSFLKQLQFRFYLLFIDLRFSAIFYLLILGFVHFFLNDGQGYYAFEHVVEVEEFAACVWEDPAAEFDEVLLLGRPPSPTLPPPQRLPQLKHQLLKQLHLHHTCSIRIKSTPRILKLRQ